MALLDEPDLAAGAAFGSNMVNLLMIGLLDAFWRSGPILDSLGLAFVAQAVFGIAIICLAALGLLIHSTTASFAGWYLSPVSLLLLGTFLVAMYTVFSWGKTHPTAEDEPVEPDEVALEIAPSLASAVGVFSLAAAVVFVCAIWLARTGDGLAIEMGWDASFVGTQFLAISTSLPEQATSIRRAPHEGAGVRYLQSAGLQPVQYGCGPLCRRRRLYQRLDMERLVGSPCFDRPHGSVDDDGRRPGPGGAQVPFQTGSRCGVGCIDRLLCRGQLPGV